MNFYFINPEHIEEHSWEGIIDILNIKAIIDFNQYNNEIKNLFTSKNEIFNNIEHNYTLKDYRPEYLELLQPIERAKCLKKGVQSIFYPLIDKAIQMYEANNRKSKGTWNILVLNNDTLACNSVVYYSAYYFYNRLYYLISREGKGTRRFIDFFRIDFINLKTLVYSVDVQGFCSFDDKLTSEYDYRNLRLSSFFSLLNEKYNINYNTFFKKNKTDTTFISKEVLDALNKGKGTETTYIPKEEDLDYYLLDESKIDSNSGIYTLKNVEKILQVKQEENTQKKLKGIVPLHFIIGNKYTKQNIKSILQTIYNEIEYKKIATALQLNMWFLTKPCVIKNQNGKYDNGFEILGNNHNNRDIKVLIEEDLEQLPWMFEPIELRRFNSFSLYLLDRILSKKKDEYSKYDYYNVFSTDVMGAIVIAVQRDGEIIKNYHFRSDLDGCIGTIYIWGINLQYMFDTILEDGYILDSRLQVVEISYRTVNVPQPVIGALITTKR